MEGRALTRDMQHLRVVTAVVDRFAVAVVDSRMAVAVVGKVTAVADRAMRADTSKRR